MAGFCVHPGEGVPLPVIGGEVLADGGRTGGRLTVIRSTGPAHDEVPRHIHHDLDESFHVLSGRYTITCGDEVFTAGPGAFVHLPRGVPHGYRTGAEPTEKLIISVPAGIDAFFRDLDDGVAPDVLAHRHGVTFL